MDLQLLPRWWCVERAYIDWKRDTCRALSAVAETTNPDRVSRRGVTFAYMSREYGRTCFSAAGAHTARRKRLQVSRYCLYIIIRSIIVLIGTAEEVVGSCFFWAWGHFVERGVDSRVTPAILDIQL